MNNTYTILKGDCLSLIAERFGVDEETLMKLNSAQIKNPDLIYEGNKLVLSLSTPMITDNSRSPLPEAPQCPANGPDTCQPIKPLDDILYVPAHPVAGKPMWYAINNDTKVKILEEKELLANAVDVNDTKKTLQALNKLGVMSKFTTRTHEHFMDETTMEQYRALLLAKMAIETHAIEIDGKKPNDELLKIAKVIDLDIAKSYQWLLSKHSLSPHSTNNHATVESLSSKKTIEEHREAFLLRVNQKLRSEVLEQLEKKVESLEKQAEKNANNTVSSDKSPFVYSDKLEYFTTKTQTKLGARIESLRSKRVFSEDELILKSTTNAREEIEFWLSELKKMPRDFQAPEINVALILWAQNLSHINLAGYTIKEQCLTLNQLTGKPGAPLGSLNSRFEWLKTNIWNDIEPLDIKEEDTRTFIQKLYELSGSAAENTPAGKDMSNVANSVDREWGYYPALALMRVIDATVTKHQSALGQLFKDKSSVFDEVFSQLLWIKKVASARIENLKAAAQKKAQQGLNHLEFTVGDTTLTPTSLTLLWDEALFKPKETLPSGFQTKSGYNDLQVVECSLLSDGSVFYVRAPIWFMPKDESAPLFGQAAGHVQIITGNISVVNKESGAAQLIDNHNIKQALTEMVKKNAKLEVMPAKLEGSFNSVFWKDSYHYKDGVGPDRKSPAYSVDAEAQFMRFSSKAEVELNSPVSTLSLSQPRNMGLSGGASATLTALQGQLNFSFWYPLHDKHKELKASDYSKVSPCELKIPYINKANKEEPYDAGGICANVSGAVYGLAAASCQLSTKFTIGPTDTGQGIGIKGQTIDIFDSNIKYVKNFHSTNGLAALESAKLASELSAEVDVFAGVEAGGHLNASVYWTPPKDRHGNSSAPQRLGSIGAKLAAAWGVGGKAGMRLIFQNGVLILSTEAGLVFGPGSSGKVDIALDAEGADDFVDCLLGVLKLSHFRRLAVFGEADENGINEDFQTLNDIMTIAAALGLTVSKVLLMPMTSWSDYKQQVTGREYAPFLARNITNAEINNGSMKKWVLKLPPETLGNLLAALSEPQMFSQTSELKNQMQAQAIVQIMTWLVSDSSVEKEANQRRWKETLISMGNLPKGKKNYPLEWQTYLEQWLRLAKFVKNNEGINGITQLFSDYSFELNGNMIITLKESNIGTGILGGIKEYHYSSYPISCVLNASAASGNLAEIVQETGLAPNHWALEKTNETIIRWDVEEIGERYGL
ncbi:LysM peptidoglycan-binding domain-containing protein [Vibrio scophthalmi]|uniref:LysM domain-containing protein n=1 Tax=Vibrio scophthalmi TaxID=45658 RepID=A0A1E3WLC7_9VIBR|nr:LysM domain-containing protein [Vibrio scophthalmi]ODS10574.1 hypothetical protein VSF3289_00833 [Vibrio scophthalmi]